MTVAKIVFASLTGNTEEIADVVAETLEDLAIEVEMEEVGAVEAEDFESADICIVATYTYSEGDLPEEMKDFYEELQELDLTGKIYGVVGSGDTFYENFATSVNRFEEAFEKTGAIKGADFVKVDTNAEEEDIQNLEAFAKKIAAVAN
ncbi:MULTISPECIES: flavodoxin [Enterococcus]|uniref:flavodoxin n=1 Tax=Enterococcus sp. AZ103 TaxID=2774628 RepID=UPI003F28B732